MPKQTLKRFLPTPTKLRKIGALRILGEWIYEPNLWHINRSSTSAAFFIGIFVAFIPVPSQMVFAALLAIWFRCNLPLAVGLCWITNPVTMGPIFWFSYKLGALVMGEPASAQPFAISWQWFTDGLLLVWQPLLLGCAISGFFFGSLGYFVMRGIWRWQVMQRWEARRERRRAVLEATTRAVELRQEAIAQHVAQDKATPESTTEKPPG